MTALRENSYVRVRAELAAPAAKSLFKIADINNLTVKGKTVCFCTEAM